MVAPVPCRPVPYPGPGPQRARILAVGSREAPHGTNLWVTQQCSLCLDNRDDVECPRYRPLGNIYQGHRLGENVCSIIGCNRRLCQHHMRPQGPTTHSASLWYTFCSECYQRRPHCTSCGVLGRDHLSWHYGEPAAKAPRGQPLWPCWPAGGCEH